MRFQRKLESDLQSALTLVASWRTKPDGQRPVRDWSERLPRAEKFLHETRMEDCVVSFPGAEKLIPDGGRVEWAELFGACRKLAAQVGISNRDWIMQRGRGKNQWLLTVRLCKGNLQPNQVDAMVEQIREAAADLGPPRLEVGKCFGGKLRCVPKQLWPGILSYCLYVHRVDSQQPTDPSKMALKHLPGLAARCARALRGLKPSTFTQTSGNDFFRVLPRSHFVEKGQQATSNKPKSKTPPDSAAQTAGTTATPPGAAGDQPTTQTTTVAQPQQPNEQQPQAGHAEPAIDTNMSTTSEDADTTQPAAQGGDATDQRQGTPTTATAVKPKLKRKQRSPDLDRTPSPEKQRTKPDNTESEDGEQAGVQRSKVNDEGGRGLLFSPVRRRRASGGNAASRSKSSKALFSRTSPTPRKNDKGTTVPDSTIDPTTPVQEQVEPERLAQASPEPHAATTAECVASTPTAPQSPSRSETVIQEEQQDEDSGDTPPTPPPRA